MAKLIYTAITSLDGYIEDEGGKPGLPRGARMGLELLAERRFGSGVVHMAYRNR